MYNTPFFIPGYNPMMMNQNLIRGIPSAANTLANTATRTSTGGLFSKLGSSLSGIKAINWGGLINNTSKTLGIINQTIPLVRQVGPMVTNMKSMLRVASLFKDETDPPAKNYNQIKKNNNLEKNIYTSPKPSTKQPTQSTSTYITNTQEYDSSPTFFINT